jgi:hypothetical protein
MALVVITISDSPDGAQVVVQAEPAIPAGQPNVMLTSAQAAALTMLNALQGEIKQDRGLIQLLS